MPAQPSIDLALIAEKADVSATQIEAVAGLLDSGNTIPFITRYRKEQTGNLNEVQLCTIRDELQKHRQLVERAASILKSIESQGELTSGLRRKILKADSLKRLEDLYLPFKPKRRSRAVAARERGLGPLAERIWNADAHLQSLKQAARDFVDSQNELPDTESVLAGVADIVAERVAEHADVRERARQIAARFGRLEVSVAKNAGDDAAEFRNYFDYGEAVSRIPPHRVLAINRGEKQSALKVRFVWDAKAVEAAILRELNFAQHRFRSFLEDCVTDARARLLQPSIDREIRRDLTDRAEIHAVGVFANNLRNLLLQPTMNGKRVLAIDPGLRTGCKLAALDEVGNCLATSIVYVTGSEERRSENRQKLADFLRDHDCHVIAIGNGTACRETEELVSEVLREFSGVHYVVVNEAGASVYSTSSQAQDEFPEYDATERGTISIGRRLLDPLSELVKIDPRHIGVGMYQHDLNEKKLEESLDQVIESCVNLVGVDLNTASLPLLRRVSGLNQSSAKKLVEWRTEHGSFQNRRQLLDVPGIGKSTFTQAAGFLRIRNGDSPLDATWIHPESYEAAHQLLERFDATSKELLQPGPTRDAFHKHVAEIDAPALAEKLNVGLPTLQDIVESLLRPDRDPREESSGPVFRKGILKLDDLAVGMELQGSVLNVVDFGAFVDIGLKDSGLVHISKMSTNYVADPHEFVAVGELVTVWVLGIDRDRKRVSLTMVSPHEVAANL